MKRKLLLTGAAMLGVFVLLLFALPFLVDADRFRPQVEKEAGVALGREVKIGKLSLSLFSGGVEASELTVADDAAFGSAPFVTAKSLKIGVEVWPLIFSRQMNIRSLTLDRPEIVLLRNAQGKWNFSTLGAVEKQKGASGAAPPVSVGHLRVVNGRLRVGQAGKTKQQVYEEVNISARNVSLTSAIPFQLEAKAPGGGAIEAAGKFGPMKPGNAAASPLNADISVERLDLASTGFVDPASGIGGILDYKGKATSDGATMKLTSTATADALRLVRGGAASRRPVRVESESVFDLHKENGTVKGTIFAGNSRAALNGDFDVKRDTPVVHLKLKGDSLAINDVEGLLPAFGVVLPPGAALRGGNVTVNLSADGPLDRLVITGPVNISNTKLAGFNLGAKLAAISALAGIKPSSETVIEAMSAGLRVAPEGIRADNLSVVLPSIGTVNGAGTIAGNHALNFKMSAKLSNPNLLGTMNSLTTLGQSKGVPFLVQGTTSNPVFVPDLAGAVGGTVKAPVKGVGGLLGLFGRKKKE